MKSREELAKAHQVSDEVEDLHNKLAKYKYHYQKLSDELEDLKLKHTRAKTKMKLLQYNLQEGNDKNNLKRCYQEAIYFLQLKMTQIDETNEPPKQIDIEEILNADPPTDIDLISEPDILQD